MIVDAGRQRIPLRRDTVDLAALVRRLDLVLLLAAAALVGYGLWAVAGITRFDVLRGESFQELDRIAVYPKTHYVTPKSRLELAIEGITEEQFVEAAEAAKAGCPVSKALAGTTITLDARLA